MYFPPDFIRIRKASAQGFRRPEAEAGSVFIRRKSKRPGLRRVSKRIKKNTAAKQADIRRAEMGLGS